MDKLASWLLPSLLFALAAPAVLADPQPTGSPAMLFGDTSTLGRPFSKDPSVVKFNGRYLMYYSLPGKPISNNAMEGWSIGIAESQGCTHVGELPPGQAIDKKGLCAPGAIVLDGKVHLFYQTYGTGAKDASCHAWSADGIHFSARSATPSSTPRASGPWGAPSTPRRSRSTASFICITPLVTRE